MARKKKKIKSSKNVPCPASRPEYASFNCTKRAIAKTKAQTPVA